MRTNAALRTLLLALLVAAPAGAIPVRQLSLPANDLVYDPVTKLIYASVPGAAGSLGNSLTAIDPETGQVGPSVSVGSEPGKLAISDQGRYLYISLDGAAAVRRFDTVAGTAGLQFSLGSGYGPNFADDLAVVPGHPELVAISLYNKGISPNGVGVFVFENGIPRPKSVKGVNALAYSNDPSRLYGYDNQSTGFGFLRMKADDTGIPGGDWLLLMTGFGVRILYDGGRIYATNGGVYDPEAGKLLGTLPGGVIRPDAALGRVFLLQGDGPNVQLQAFDASTFVPLWSAHIAGVSGGVASLIRWGSDGLAFRTGGGQVFLLHTGAISSAPSEFTLTLNPTTAAGEATMLGTITLATPAPSTGATVLLSSSDPVAAAVPPQVIVAPGSTTAAFPVLTHAVTAAEDVGISATAGGLTRTATLHLVPPPPPPAPAGPVFNQANGHWYQAVPAPGGITWPNARAAAAAMSYAGYPGHLVTITSADENQFLVRNLPLSLDDHWRVGGYQDHTAPDYTEPAGGWRWITGEPWGYTNWRGGEPNNVGGEDFLEIHSDGTWNDTADQPPGGGYLIEYEPLAPLPPPTAPSSAALLLFPNPVPGGLLALGQVTLAQPAGPGGVLINLTSSNPAAAVVPASITVLPGATTATFPMITFAVSQPTPVTITASGSFGTATATLQVLPLGSPAPPPPATNLLVNGSFEDPPAPAGQAYATFGSGGIPGWRVLKGTVDLDQEWQQAPGQGRQSLGLVGTPGAGTVEQSFATEPGREYVFAGWISHDYGLGTPEGRADVYLNGAFFVQLFHNAPTSQTDMQWTPFSYPFRATTARTTLRMTDVTDISSYQGLVLDGLSVTLADQSPPVVTPTAELPAPSDLTARFLTGAGVELTWTDNSADENAFAVWRKTPTSDWTRIGVLAPNTTTFMDQSVTPGTSCIYRVRATRGNVASAWSNQASATTPSP